MKNKIGVYYGFLAESDEVDWIDCLTRAKAAGMDILEISASRLLMLPERRRREIAACARDLDLSLTSATGLPREGDLSSEDKQVRDYGVRFLTRQLQLLHDMGGITLGGMLVGTGKYFPAGVEHTRARAAEIAVEPLKKLADIAGDMGICLCMEAINRFEAAYLNTAEEAVLVAEAVDSPHLGVLLDSFHMNIEERSLGDAIRRTGKHLRHFHACENNRMVPGRALLNWDDVFAGLRDIGYTGPLVMEAMAKPYGATAGRLNIWRRLSEDPDMEIAAGGRFLREKGVEYGL